MPGKSAGKSILAGMPRPTRIAIVGGTHGNERGGVLVVEEIRNHPENWRFPGLEIDTFFGNPEAIRINRRYVERDLNRCFGEHFPEASPTAPLYEQRRAWELSQELRPDGRPYDLLIDLHNTTGAMGVSWILTNPHPWPWYLGWQAWLADPDLVRIYHTPETLASNVFVPSLGTDEITLEIGCAIHGTSPHWAYEAARNQTRDILERLSSLPMDFDPVAPLRQTDFPLYLEGLDVEFPRDAQGNVCGLLHKDLLGRDYQPVKEGDALFFLPGSQETVRHQGETFWPVFVAEEAYVEKEIAFVKTALCSWAGGKDTLS